MSGAAKSPEIRGQMAPRFAKGQSGNPAGRPRSLPRFRARCRIATFEALAELRKAMIDPEIPLGEKVKAFEAMADRGGFLPADKEAALDAGRARIILAALALQGLNDEQRKALLAAVGEAE